MAQAKRAVRSTKKKSSKGVLSPRGPLSFLKNKLPLVIIVVLLAAYGTYRLFSAHAATSAAYTRQDCTAQNHYKDATVPTNSGVPGYNADGSASQQSCVDSSAEAWAVKAYIATFGRAPESLEAYSYWANRYMTYGSWPSGELLEKLQDTSEAKNNFGKLDNSHKVDWLYNNVLQRQPDGSGKTFWENRIAEKGVVTVMYEFLRLPEGLRKMQPRIAAAFAMLPASYTPTPPGTSANPSSGTTTKKPSSTSTATGNTPTTDNPGTPDGTSAPKPDDKTAPWKQDVGEGVAVDKVSSTKWGNYSPPKSTDCYNKSEFKLNSRDDCINRLRADLNTLMDPNEPLSWGRLLDTQVDAFLRVYQTKVGLPVDGKATKAVWGYLAFEVKEKPTTTTTIAKPAEKKPNLAQLIANVPASWWDWANCRSYSASYESKPACVRRLSRSLFNMGIYPGPSMEKGQASAGFKNAVWWYELKYLCIQNGANGFAEQSTWDLILKGSKGYNGQGCPQPKPPVSTSNGGGGGGGGGTGGGSRADDGDDDDGHKSTNTGTGSSGCSDAMRRAGECSGASSGTGCSETLRKAGECSSGYGPFPRPSSCPSQKFVGYKFRWSITHPGSHPYYDYYTWTGYACQKTGSGWGR